ncbi:hypothetical protein D3C74_367570 [compost metagenome]
MIWCRPSITITSQIPPSKKPANAPPTDNIQLTATSRLSATNPANGMIKKMVSNPAASTLRNEVTIRSMELGMILCNLFSIRDKIQTANTTPMIPPCPAIRGSPVNKLWIGSSGFIPVRRVAPPITPPKDGLAPNTLAELMPTKIAI